MMQDNGEALSKLAKGEEANVFSLLWSLVQMFSSVEPCVEMFKGGEPYVFNYKTPELECCLQEMIEVKKS